MKMTCECKAIKIYGAHDKMGLHVTRSGPPGWGQVTEKPSSGLTLSRSRVPGDGSSASLILLKLICE